MHRPRMRHRPWKMQLEGLSGAALARKALDIRADGTPCKRRQTDRNLSSTIARLEDAQELLDEFNKDVRDEAEMKIEERNAQLLAPPPPGTEMAITVDKSGESQA